MQMDVAAYIWPSYHDDPRSRIFWNQGFGEWQSVLSARPKYEAHIEPRLPVWGTVNEADPYVMGMEIDAAAGGAAAAPGPGGPAPRPAAP